MCIWLIVLILRYPSLDYVSPLSLGKIHAIGQATGNGWRKVFNVYAKIVFALNVDALVSLKGCKNWQQYRAFALLQYASNTKLVFSEPVINDVIHIIMG